MKARWIFLLVMVSVAAVAQTPAQMGAISGVVQDSAGAVIPGVRVIATGPRGSATTVTDSEGSYSLPVSPGTYTVTATLPGFVQSVSDITVGNGSQVRQSFTLQVAPRGFPPPPRPNPRNRSVEITADRQSQQGMSILYRGNVRVITENLELNADELDLNRATGTGDIRGNVTMHVKPTGVRVVPLSN